MAQKALFISTNDLKVRSVIDGMVDDDKIVQWIELAQDTHIHRFLGTDLYNKLQADIIAGTLVGDYLTLVNSYIKPMLIWYAQASYLPFASAQIGNSGVFKRLPENSESVTKEELDYLVVKINEAADSYTKLYLDYMCANSELFPEYSTNSDGDQYPEREHTYSPWVL